MRYRYLAVCLLLMFFVAPSSFATICEELSPARKALLKGTTCDRLDTLMKPGVILRVIIGVEIDTPSPSDWPWMPEGTLDSAAIDAQRTRMTNVKGAVRIAHPTMEAVPDRDFASIPYFVADIDRIALDGLLRNSVVKSIEEPNRFVSALVETTAVIGARKVHTENNFQGRGQTVVILDGGVERNHPFLKGRVLSQYEACFSTTIVNDKSKVRYDSLCNPAPPSDKPFGTAEPCGDGSPLMNCGHGTRVAGVAAGYTSNISSDPLHPVAYAGVAPAASILPIKITSRLTEGTETKSYAQIEDMVAALEYVGTLATKPQFRRVVETSSGIETRSRLAVNISMEVALAENHPDRGPVSNGFSTTRTACASHSPSLVDSVAALAALDIPVIAATGNKERKDGFTIPSCIPGVIAVSATADDDTVAWYANVAHQMDLFAPGGDSRRGTQISTSEPPARYTNDSGTSLAAPHVTGAFALLREADPLATFQQLRDRLIATGEDVRDCRDYSPEQRPVCDANNARVEKPRIDVGKAVAVCDYPFWGATALTENDADLAQTKPGDSVATRVLRVPSMQRVYLVVEMKRSKDVDKAATDFWEIGELEEISRSEQATEPPGSSILRRVFLTSPVSGDQTFTVTARVPGDGCTRRISFRIVATNVPRVTVAAGQCQTVTHPVVRAHVNDQIQINTRLYDADNAVITKLNDVTFEWSTDGEILLKGTGDQFRTLTHLVTAEESPIDIKVTTADGAFGSTQIDMLVDPTPLSTGIYVRRCKARPVRHLGDPISHYTFAEGEVATFEVPELISGATYEWHSRTDAGSDEILGTGTTLTTGDLQGARLYVITRTSTEQSESAELSLASDAGSSPRIGITPSYQSIPAAGTARITATFTPASGTTALYEWRKGATYDTTTPVIEEGPTLTLAGQPEGGVYWCRVIESGPSGDKYYYSRFASVNVHCSPQIAGSILVNPARVAKNQMPQLFASTNAKEGIYTWYRFLPNQTPTVTGSGWYVLYPIVQALETQFRVQVTDSCGTSGTLGDVSVFLCVPTIEAQPAPATIAETQPTLAIDVEPAIAGQPLTITWHRSSDPYQATSLGEGLTFPTPTQTAGTTQSYYAAVKSTCGSSSATHVIKSNPALVEICAKPGITSYTALKETKGEAAILLVSATGTDLTYQWYRGDTTVTTYPLAGKTDPSLSIAPSTTTKYWVQIKSRGVCVKDSPTMTIKVCALPAIITQPKNTRVFPNKTATLSVTATNPAMNGDPLKYAWSQGTSLITGATAATYTTAPITAQTTFTVEVSSGICKTASATATVSLCTYPEVVSPTSSTFSIASGGTATLSLPALSPVLTKNVTWYRGAPLDRSYPVSSGQDVASYTTPPLTATTQYWAEFDENGCVSRTSAYTVNVCKPTITTQPQSVTILPNAQQTLTVTATPAAGLTYQWYTGAAGDTTAPISGATSGNYTTPAMTSTTTYWVRVTGCTAVNSTAATVTVCAPPAVTSVTKTAGDTYNSTGSVTVNATGTSLTYQWHKGQSGDVTQPISGATAATYTFTRKTSEYYWARVKSNCTTAIANSAAVFATVDPVIAAHPQSLSIPAGGSTTLNVTATGTYLTYQWYQGSSTAITGATGASYTTPALSTATTYWCRVTSGGLSVADSNSATVSICAGPTINSFGSTSVGVNSWRLTVNVAAPEDPSVGVVYHWYSGTRGNPAQSIDLGEGSYYRTFYDLTQPTTYWVRVWWDNYTCYSDTAAKTLTPQ